jgi:hypothetical protein
MENGNGLDEDDFVEDPKELVRSLITKILITQYLKKIFNSGLKLYL